MRSLDWRDDSVGKTVVIQILGLDFDLQNPWEKPGVMTMLKISELGR